MDTRGSEPLDLTFPPYGSQLWIKAMAVMLAEYVVKKQAGDLSPTARECRSLGLRRRRFI